MSGFISVNIEWDNTFISVSSEHDRESRSDVSTSTTTVHDVVEMIKDCADRAAAAVDPDGATEGR